MQIFELQITDYDAFYNNNNNNGTSDSNSEFRKINRNTVSFLIWRVEQMNLVAVSKEQYGIFYDTDSYVIYVASTYGQPIWSRESKSGNLEYHVHFWLGSSTTPEKSGVAAYKTVELDNYLLGLATQHRETQGNESARFKSYFKSGLRVLVAHLQTKELSFPKLYKIMGKCTPTLIQMDLISWNKFNSTDVLILQTENILFVWTGRSAEAVQKLTAAKASKEIKEQHNIKRVVFVDDGYEKTLEDTDKIEWNKFLSLEKRQVLPENASETESLNQRHKTIRLYKCSENNGKYRVAEMKTGPLSQTDLIGDDVFIIDQGLSGIWVWVGKRATEKERRESLRNARGFVKKKNYQHNTKVTRVVDGFEPFEFKSLFPYWKDENTQKQPRGTLVSKLDALTMEERPCYASETQLIDDGSGSVTLWRVKQTDLVEISKERHGYFFSGDCYIVLYSYQTSAEEKHLLYYWLGTQATPEETATVVSKIKEIHEELGGLSFKARLIQGREPPHFLQLFKGKLTLFQGKGTDFDESGRNQKLPMQYFLQIFGSTLASSKAIQVQARAAHLNSNYCFLVKKGKHAIIWCGNYSTGDQREIAKLFAGKDFELVLEGKEKSGFFELLGGKSAYYLHLNKTEGDKRPPRLLNCYKINGTIRAEEILFFAQSDLLPENVMLLDYHSVIYLWIGHNSTREDQNQSLQIAVEYLQSDPCGRDFNIPIIQIHQKMEPPTFIGFFSTWNEKLWKHHKTFGKLRQDIEQKYNGSINYTKINGHRKSSHTDFDQYDKYPLNILKEPNDKLPSKVDSLKKEVHLTHDDFVALLEMTYLEFERLPLWKQQELKKKVGLF